MVKHYVFFKIKSEYTEEQKKEALKEIADALGALPGKIKEILSLEIGINETDRNGASDIGLISEFESFETLDIYRFHPEHVKVVEIIAKHKESGTSLDYATPVSVFKK